VIPISHNQDVVGSFGKTVKDAVIGLEAIVGFDPRDNATAGQLGKVPRGGYTQFLANRKALKGVKLGLPWRRIWTAPTTQPELEGLLNAVKILEANGAEIYNNTEYLHLEEIVPPNGTPLTNRLPRGFH
jgi:amidase